MPLGGGDIVDVKLSLEPHDGSRLNFAYEGGVRAALKAVMRDAIDTQASRPLISRRDARSRTGWSE